MKYAFKKQMIASIIGVFLSISIVNHVSAATPVTIVMDGMTAPYANALPFVNEGSTMVPIRFVSENLEAKVSWNNATKTVGIIKSDTNINLKVGSSYATVNGVRNEVGAKSIQKNGTVMVPLRFVSEILGVDVKWNANDLTVKISTGKELGAIDDQGRVLRKNDLPTNASAYPYILKDIPNAMYELAGRNIPGSTSKTAKQLYASDKLFRNGIYPKLWANNADEYYKLILNVDYRTIGSDWVDEVYGRTNTANPMLESKLQKYVSWVKKNHIIIEGDLSSEPSMISDNSIDGYAIRSHYTVKFVNFDSSKNLIYDFLFDDTNKSKKFQKGARYEGYVDIQLSTNVMNSTSIKVDPLASLFLNASFWKVK